MLADEKKSLIGRNKSSPRSDFSPLRPRPVRRKTQRETNPYPFSDSNKRYQTYDYYTRRRFGVKCARIPLDAGFTCPNKDGTCGSEGCVFCVGGSSGARGDSIREQYERAAATAERKWKSVKYIPYLQANTGTYASPERLRSVYSEAASLPGAVMLDIATRADCLGDDAIEEILRAADKLPVTVELGLQSSSDKTADIIGRGYPFDVFLKGYEKLRRAADMSGNISIGIHIINGLPEENYNDMIRTIKDVSFLRPEEVKIHLLTVLRGSRLSAAYADGRYRPMERDAYVKTVCDQLELLPPETVIARITGDGEEGALVAPLWSRRKTEVINMIDKEMYERDGYQGKYYK